MLAVRVLEGTARLLPQQTLPRSGGSSGPTREVNFQQEVIDFSGPKTIADLRSDPFGSGQRFFCGVRPRGAAASRRLHGVELPIALFDAASPFVPGDRGADMVRASALATRASASVIRFFSLVISSTVDILYPSRQSKG